jgi:hypothetical protein
VNQRTVLQRAMVSASAASATTAIVIMISRIAQGDLTPTMPFNAAFIAAAAFWLGWLSLRNRASIRTQLDLIEIKRRVDQNPDAPVPAPLRLVAPPTPEPGAADRFRVHAGPVILAVTAGMLIALGILTPRPGPQASASVPAAARRAGTVTIDATPTTTTQPALASTLAPSRHQAPVTSTPDTASSTTAETTATTTCRDRPTTTAATPMPPVSGRPHRTTTGGAATPPPKTRKTHSS